LNLRTLFPSANGTAVLGLGLLLLAAAVSPAPAQGWKSPSRRGPADARTTRVPPVDPFRPEKGGVYSNLGLLDRLARDAVREMADSLRLPPGEQVTILSTTWHEANWFVGGLLAESLTARGYRVKTGDWGVAPDTASANRALARQGHVQPQPGQAQPENGSGQEETPAPGDTTAAPPDSAAADGSLFASEGREPGKEAAEAGAPTIPPPAAPTAPVPRVTLPAGNVLDLRLIEFGVSYPQVGRKLLFGPVRFTRVGGVFAQVNSLEGPDGNFRQMVSSERHRVDRLSGSQRALVEGASYPFNPPELTPPSLSRYIEPTVVVAIVGSLVYLFYANQN
jgi:hypothetical protein